jgi:hypothetical protein
MCLHLKFLHPNVSTKFVCGEEDCTRVFKDSKSYTKHLKAKHHTSSDDLYLESPAHYENCINTDIQNHNAEETVFCIANYGYNKYGTA